MTHRTISTIIDVNGKQISTTGRDDGKVNVDVSVQDQTTPPVDLYFIQSKGPPTQLSLDVSIDDYSFTVDDATLFTVTPETFVGIFCPSQSRYFFAAVTNVAGNVITVDTPIDFDFPAGDNVIAATRNMNVNGAITPQYFSIQGAGSSDLKIDIARILITMTSSTDMDDAKFGGIAKLARGLVLRKVDGEVRNIFNVKNNGEIAIFGYDLQYSPKAPAGQYGLRARLTFSGQEKHGVAIRLKQGESLQLIIQDDLSALTSFRVLAQGHEVD